MNEYKKSEKQRRRNYRENKVNTYQFPVSDSSARDNRTNKRLC